MLLSLKKCSPNEAFFNANSKRTKATNACECLKPTLASFVVRLGSLVPQSGSKRMTNRTQMIDLEAEEAWRQTAPCAFNCPIY